MDNSKLNTEEKICVIKQIRTALDLTQEQFADQLGVKRLSIVRWENGQREPMMTFAQFKKFVELAEKAGVDSEEIPDELSKPAQSLVA